MNILIVEDDPIFAQGLQIMLEDMGYHPLGIAQEANEALRLMSATQPDLVLMDIHIRGTMDGIEVAEQMKQRSLMIPVIFLTSLQNQEVFARAKQTNPFAYLSKPVEIDQLQRAIELALHKYAHKSSHLNEWANDVAIQNSFFVKVGRRIQKVNIPDIYYLEVDRNYSTIMLKDQPLKVRMTFKELSQKLPDHQFLKINKSYIVNLAKVDNADLEKNEVQLVPQPLNT
ncbi:response regulator [uncultured Microscilla sp.]|uniref:LytR/AlgR family response regulator transcription factor n=1 Tax=uncultured Microscilla sp. TaxID=432653 RepID=UPI002618FDDC|nr:response regulator [uncultured Microscilla sp.]